MKKNEKKDEQTKKNGRSSEIPLLDTKRKIVRRKSEKGLDFRIKMYKMRNVSSKIITFKESANLKMNKKHPSICLCGRYHYNKQESTVLVAKGQDTNKAFYSNLITCGSVWRCPICSYKIQKTRQVEVFKLLKWYQDNDYKMSFLTLTMRHKKNHSLAHSVETILSEFRKFQRITPFSKFRQTYIGMVKAFEITLGANGWHPHLHIVFVHQKGIQHSEIKLHMDKLIPLWCGREKIKGLIKAQHYKPVFDEDGITDYITKWDTSKEITQGNFKIAKRNNSTTAFGLLSDVVCKVKKFDEIEQFFESYVYGTKGRNHLIISEGIRAKYKELNPHTLEDSQIVKDERIKNFLFGIGYDLWLEILKKDLSPLLLSAYDIGGFNAVCDELNRYKVDYDVEFSEDLNVNFIY